MFEMYDTRPLPTQTLRLLGGCVLRLQQYERLLKVLLAQQNISGDLDAIEAQQARRARRLAGKTLGHLTRELFESRFMSGDHDADIPLPKDAPRGSDKIYISLQVSMDLTEAQRQATKDAINELVDMRNELVHNLIDQYDFTTDEGCSAAIEHLTQCHARVDQHLQGLHEWAQSMVKARVQAAQSLIEKLKSGQISTEQPAEPPAVDWQNSTVVQALRHALETLAVDGWASLQAIRSWLGEHYPDENPQRYGRRSWQQLLDEAKLFELQYRREADSNQRVAWLRMR